MDDKQSEIDRMLADTRLFQNVYLNPGTGRCVNATEANAEANMRQYIADSPLLGLIWERETTYDGDGRFGFRVWWDDEGTKTRYGYIEIEMPGWELPRVRYMGEPGQNIWDFPRLYVDGASWIWKFAILDKRYFIPEE